MNKNKSLWILLCLSFSSLASGQVHFVPRVEVGQSSYGFTFSGGPLPFNNTELELGNEINFQLYAIRFGATVAFRNFYFDTYFQTTNSDTSVQALPGNQANPLQVWTGEKDDIYFAFGYVVNESATIFTGYRDLTISGEGVGDSDYEFNDDGVFFGGSYRWAVTDTGSLSLNAAYAFLDGEYKQTLFGTELPTGIGDGDGFKIGVAWHSSLNDSLSYVLGIDFYDYEYDLDLTTEAGKTTITVSEEEITVRVGLVFSF